MCRAMTRVLKRAQLLIEAQSLVAAVRTVAKTGVDVCSYPPIVAILHSLNPTTCFLQGSFLASPS